MAVERKGSRSSRRLQGVDPEPLSPPRSEAGDTPLDIRPRQTRSQRVSVKDLTGLVSPPLSARDSIQNAPLIESPSSSSRMVTRARASIFQEEVDSGEAVNTRRSLELKAIPTAPKRRSVQGSSTVYTVGPVPPDIGEDDLQKSRALEFPTGSEPIAAHIETKNNPHVLSLPARGVITKRRFVNSPPIPNELTGNLESARQTRSSNRKAGAVDDATRQLVPQGDDLASKIRDPPRKRQKLEGGNEKLVESKGALDKDIKSEQIGRTGAKRHISTNLPGIDVGPVAEKKKVTARKNSKAVQTLAVAALEKPPSIGKPEVWCDTRQELCESLPSFRSYQGGCYASKGFGRGYLFDGHASERDYMDGSIIISHAGGNSEEVEGERRLVRDQTWDKGVIAYLRNNCEQMVPLIAIIGERCPTAPAQLEHRYSVMDWFKVTHCWPEKDSKSGNIRCKFRFERLGSSEAGWWAAEDTPRVSEDIAIEYINCPGCRENSPWIYDNEPMCLNKDCQRFWTVHSGRGGKAPERFVYRKSFLHGKTVWPEAATIPPSPLGPGLPIGDEITESYGRDVKRKFWKGMWCQRCGKLNCRELWKSWKCTNCDWEFTPKRSYFVPADLSDQHRPEYTGPPIPENVVDPSIKSQSVVLPDGRRAMIYDIFQCGKVIHILANKKWNALPGGSDWLLEHYQDVDIPFKRHELKTHKLTGRLLTQQFSFNSGAPYKYIVEVDSISFEQSPKAVQRALQILQKDVTVMVPEALPMNEILNVAYFEEQKMDFHDDGEEDLGPCVSSISLGSPAMMYFRVKGKYCNGSLLPADKTLLQPSNPAYYCQSTTEETKRPSKRNILELRLHHGDVIVMNGRPIQRLLEHAVTPEGFRIAATARNISSYNAIANSKDFKSRRTGERLKATIGVDSQTQDGMEEISLPEVQANPSPLNTESGTFVKAMGFAESPQEEDPRDNGSISTHTPMHAEEAQYSQGKTNKLDLSHLLIPQPHMEAVASRGQNVGVYDSQPERPPVHGDNSPSVLAPSPTSILSTPDFTYYDINAASAAPNGSTSESRNAYGNLNIYEEPISPLTITRTSKEAIIATSPDPKIQAKPIAGRDHYGLMSSPQPPWARLSSQEAISPELAQYGEIMTPVPQPRSMFYWSRYGDQRPLNGGHPNVRAAEGGGDSGMPGWSSEQFQRLQNIFLSGADTPHENMA
ncbi:hypothetical protein TWF718_008398 [Orbilia javanica]|uniref:Alpha-ketoglutarate-dependent dioxygenase AlkB-like domain-containing protein n=1 Tax=Orbilia javanica TaxID=47235 RepID=A0AAN8N0Z6_9PEZI